MVPLDEPEFERWRAAADTAFRSAHAQKDGGFFGWACFVCEQAAQFALPRVAAIRLPGSESARSPAPHLKLEHRPRLPYR